MKCHADIFLQMGPICGNFVERQDTPEKIMAVFIKEKKNWEERKKKMETEERKQSVPDELSPEIEQVAESSVSDQASGEVKLQELATVSEFSCPKCDRKFSKPAYVTMHLIHFHRMHKHDVSRIGLLIKEISNVPVSLDAPAAGNTETKLLSERVGNEEAAVLDQASGEVKSQELATVSEFSCPKCDRKFSKAAYVTMHLINFHRMHKHDVSRIGLLIKEIPNVPVSLDAPAAGNTETKLLSERVGNKEASVLDQASGEVKSQELATVSEFSCPKCDRNFSKAAYVTMHLIHFHRMHRHEVRRMDYLIKETSNGPVSLDAPAAGNTETKLLSERVTNEESSGSYQGWTGGELQLQEVTKVSEFGCPICDRNFSKPALVKVHLRNFHGLNKQEVRLIGHLIKQIPNVPVSLDAPATGNTETNLLSDSVTNDSEEEEYMVEQKKHVF